MSLKEENLIAVDNIVKAGQRLVKICDTFVPVGLGGNFEPGATIIKEIGRDTFYKCVSVSDNTWTGNILILGEDGYYTVSGEVTTGLTYGIGYTPKVGKIYNADATIEVGKYNKLINIPEDGLVFYAPLSTDASTTTGQSINTVGTVSYGVVNNVPCAYFDGSCYLETRDMQKIPYSGAERTLTFWFKGGNGSNTFGYGHTGWGQGLWFVLRCSSSYISFTGYGSGNDFGFSFDENDGWNVLVATVSGNNIKIYVNSKLIGEHTMSDTCPNANDVMRIGTHCYDGDINTMYSGYLSSIRIYNRVLTEEEITALSKEFTA